MSVTVTVNAERLRRLVQLVAKVTDPAGITANCQWHDAARAARKAARDMLKEVPK